MSRVLLLTLLFVVSTKCSPELFVRSRISVSINILNLFLVAWSRLPTPALWVEPEAQPTHSPSIFYHTIREPYPTNDKPSFTQELATTCGTIYLLFQILNWSPFKIKAINFITNTSPLAVLFLPLFKKEKRIISESRASHQSFLEERRAPLRGSNQRFLE